MKSEQNRRFAATANVRRESGAYGRAYESNGPDVKIRGGAQQVAEKYLQLARDAHAGNDPVAAENLLQHAEHYFRLVAAARSERSEIAGSLPSD